MGDFFAENNFIYFLLVVAVLYLAYLQVFKGGIKKGLGKLVDRIRGGGGSAK